MTALFPTPVLSERGHAGEVAPQVLTPGPGLGPAEARPLLAPQVAAPRVQGGPPARPAAARPSCSCSCGSSSCSSSCSLRLLAQELPLRVALHIVPVPRSPQAEAVLVRLRAAVVGRVLLPLGEVPDRACVDIVDIISTYIVYTVSTVYLFIYTVCPCPAALLWPVPAPQPGVGSDQPRHGRRLLRAGHRGQLAALPALAQYPGLGPAHLGQGLQ